ncbi:MAG TPA: translation initiation factor IF-5A [Candidatus Nanoarchaeia archaeon]|nr:translation initiation factor IF-5A [Candidatus Nanoarchaeia archaeon]
MTIKTTDIGSIKVGGYIIIDGVACRVVSVQTSKTGKHGHAKARIEAIGLINDDKKVIVKPSHDKAEVPIVEKKSAQVLSVNNDVANVMDTETFETFDIKIPEELKGKVQENSNVVFWIILGIKVLKQMK